MTLTVADLIEDPVIRTRVLAGASGLSRVVVWAHTCELTDPWNWMGRGDLLMTDGYGFPAGPDEQVLFIQNLADSGIAGVAIAEGFAAPPLTREASRAAEALSFPILLTARSVPFVTIARIVADRNQGSAGSRAARVLRLYDVLRRSHLGEIEQGRLLESIGKQLDAGLHVLDLKRGREIISGSHALDPDLRAEIVAYASRQDGRLPGISRLPAASGSALLVPLGDSRAALVAKLGDAQSLDLVLIQHASMIVGLEVERVELKAARQRDRGAALLRRILDSSIAPEVAEAQLRALKLGPPPWRVIAWEGSVAPSGAISEVSDTPTHGDLADELAALPWASIQLVDGLTHLVVVSEDVFDGQIQTTARDVKAVAGASQPFTTASRFADAVREARWALEGSRASHVNYAKYGTHGSYFLPRTIAEGEEIVRRLLGPVIDYDSTNGTELLHSLWTFFESNRSWQEGARRLGIHKQTLTYRMKKVEELTAVGMRDFGAQAELYMALRTWRILRNPR